MKRNWDLGTAQTSLKISPLYAIPRRSLKARLTLIKTVKSEYLENKAWYTCGRCLLQFWFLRLELTDVCFCPCQYFCLPYRSNCSFFRDLVLLSVPMSSGATCSVRGKTNLKVFSGKLPIPTSAGALGVAHLGISCSISLKKTFKLLGFCFVLLEPCVTLISC